MSPDNQSISTPSYYAVIPANVRYCKDLEANAKLLYGEITALCSQYGYCWATNQYFADLYSVDSRTIRRWIESLIKNEFIQVEISGDSFNSKRKIFIVFGNQKSLTADINVQKDELKKSLLRTKMSGGEDKNVHHSITCINTPVVVVGEDPPPHVVEDVHNSNLVKDDVFLYSARCKMDWSPQEIDSAWIAFENSKSCISEPILYIEGIINKKRALHKTVRGKSCPNNQTSQQIKREELENSKLETSVRAMNLPRLARFA